MKKNITLILGLLLVAITTTAQTIQSGGLIGKNTATVTFTDGMLNASDLDTFSTSLKVNGILTENIDVGVTYSYTWLEGKNNVDFNNVGAYALAYLSKSQFKPFVKAGLNYNWEDIAFYKKNYVSWNTSVGLEYSPTSKLGFTFSGGVVDDFGPSHSGFETITDNWRANVGTNYWVTDSIGAVIDVGYREGGNYAVTAGITYKY